VNPTDVLAIQQLLARYCLALDMDDMDAYGRLWAPDAELHLYRSVWIGPDEITEHIAQANPGLHMAGIPDLTIDGDRATGMQGFLFVERDGHAIRMGRYDDTYVRLDGEWRFASRKISFIRTPKAD
jgi:hypothetical protein